MTWGYHYEGTVRVAKPVVVYLQLIYHIYSFIYTYQYTILLSYMYMYKGGLCSMINVVRMIGHGGAGSLF